MKLRIKGNSLRIRLDRRDLNQLASSGRVEDVIQFASGWQGALTYAIVVGAAPRGRPQVRYAPGQILLVIDRDDVQQWQHSEQVGFDHLQPGEAGEIRILLEKDFACIDRPEGDEADDAFAFPNPSDVC